MLYSLSAKLEQKELDSIRTLERDLGKPVLAFSALPAEPAAVGPEQLAKVREVERSLGITLVVVDRANRD